MVSLGCAKNLVDSEHMLGLLHADGYEPAGDLEDADIAVINTCGFIQDAVEEAIETTLEMVRLKNRKKIHKVIVAGCFVQRYGYKLSREIPEVDGWLGTGEIHRIVEIIERGRADNGPGPMFIGRPRFLADHTVPRLRSAPFYSAYLKIAEGCSHHCTYCMIPRLTGPYRSRTPESLVEEATSLVRHGAKEINLVAQDISRYGQDLVPRTGIEDLLEPLLKISGIRWLRLIYCHPEGVSERLLDLIEREEVLCPYLDIPFQHIHPEILDKMGRSCPGEHPLALLERIRARKRRISVRTTLMVGFPGETEAQFQALYDFVETARFDHLGVFVFKREKGTRAARWGPSVPVEVSAKRRDAIMALQAGISRTLNRRMIGRVIPVLIEGPCDETDLLLKGRSATMAPEVDSQVLINKGEGVVGEIDAGIDHRGL